MTEKQATWNELKEIAPVDWGDLWDKLETLNGKKTKYHDGANLNIWLAIHLLKKDFDDIQKDLYNTVDDLENDVKTIKSKLRKNILTPLQLEVLGLVREGLGTKEISEKLHLSEPRVSAIKNRLKELGNINNLLKES